MLEVDIFLIDDSFKRDKSRGVLSRIAAFLGALNKSAEFRFFECGFSLYIILKGGVFYRDYIKDRPGQNKG